MRPANSTCTVQLLSDTVPAAYRPVLHALVTGTGRHIDVQARLSVDGWTVGISPLTRHRNGRCLCEPGSTEPKHVAARERFDRDERGAAAKAAVERAASASLAAALLPASGVHQDAPRQARNEHHPAGWAPAVKYDGGRPTELVSPRVESHVDAGDPDAVMALVESLNGPALPPGWQWELSEARYDPVAWTRDPGQPQGADAVTRPAWRYRFRVVPVSESIAAVDMDELRDLAAGLKVRAVGAPGEHGKHMVVGIGDLQAGQADGDGILGLQVRLDAIPGQIRAEFARLKRAGERIVGVLIVSGGDLVEGCDGYYAQMTATVQAHRRGQVNVVRRALLKATAAAADLGVPVDVLVVAGNHGENRKDGKSYMGDGDNDDVAVWEQVEDALRFGANARKYGHVTFHIPDDALVATLLLHGLVFATTHGHLSGGGATPEKKIDNWLARQALAKTPAGDADFLLTWHFHTWRVGDLNGVRWSQGPALCDASKHFTERYGMTSTGPALLTFTFGPLGADDWKLHRVDYEAAAEALEAVAA